VLHRDDARIGAELPIELAVSDVECDDAPRAALQEHVGEAPCRGPDVERQASRHVETEDVERVRELDAAAAHIGMIGAAHRDDGVRRDAGARLAGRLAVHGDDTGEDQRACALARRRQAALDEQDVYPSGVLQWVRDTTQRARPGSCPPRPAFARLSSARSMHSPASRRDSARP
jgi:hypothetical protein